MAGFGCQGHGVNIHPTGSGAHSTMIQGAGLEWVNGAPVEDATAVLQLLKEDMPFLAQHIEDWGALPALPCTDTAEYYGTPRCWLDPITHISRRKNMCGV
ncbi:hypothetical protein FRC0141_02148 [Corynebacterium diphtheriae]|nr:hypothetical protein CIP107510_02152 [Corynebacterium diphtheriae]CAB0665635.1 hypothetical protein CIP107573_02077 [Corynebacterium diphtheriae]CAB0674430.1 hypothetical protein FRC0024_00135 [Corynebacterium diphtheriae]CAB0741135.1 hypothetical protein FRC0101_02123 [Corynebacterium diphtheriae]CAB0761896.1 hypothetical protein FRC0119_02140 [Corynebacterium diphtheriae]